MKSEIKTEKIPIKLWIDKIEPEALNQAKNLANLPFAVSHIALMPDTHVGFGMPIGGVLATDKVVIPNAVGVDIGCGMCALKTSLTEVNLPQLKKIFSEIRNLVPVGFKHHKKAGNENLMPPLPANPEKKMPIVMEEYYSARHQLGTLGGGNHFIEIQKDENNFIWIMIHSGSRNIGYKVAAHYNKLAKEMSGKLNVKIPQKWDLAYLPLDSKTAQQYLSEMNYCINFALESRKQMMNSVVEAFRKNDLEFNSGEIINIAHNYASEENHFGKNVIVHRKGATAAGIDTIGIIPGSQGTSSFIVKGKGNPESFNSCSHGAGRVLGRKQAQKNLDLNSEKLKLDNLGILHSIRSKKDLDEAPGAYKDINEVMKNQEDLVDIVTELKPLAVLKG